LPHAQSHSEPIYSLSIYYAKLQDYQNSLQLQFMHGHIRLIISKRTHSYSNT